MFLKVESLGQRKSTLNIFVNNDWIWEYSLRLQNFQIFVHLKKMLSVYLSVCVHTRVLYFKKSEIFYICNFFLWSHCICSLPVSLIVCQQFSFSFVRTLYIGNLGLCLHRCYRCLHYLLICSQLYFYSLSNELFQMTPLLYSFWVPCL